MHPVLLHIGPVVVYSFGFLAVVALLVWLFIFWRLAKQYYPESELIFDTAIITLLGAGIVGRLGFSVLHVAHFWPNVLTVINVFSQEGFVYYGALLGGSVALWWFTKKRKLPTIVFMNALALATPLAHSIGLAGAFLAGSLYGTGTNLPIGVAMVGLNGRRFPVQLLEMFLEIAIFAFLILKVKKQRQANCLIWYILLYSVSRVVVEIFRGDAVYWFGIKSMLIVSIVSTIIACFFLYKSYTTNRNRRVVI